MSTAHLGLSYYQVVEAIWQGYRNRSFISSDTSYTPISPIERQEKTKLEIIVEEVLKEVDRCIHAYQTQRDELLLRIVSEAAFDDGVSHQMLERASELLARAAIARLKKEDEGKAKQDAKTETPPVGAGG